MSVVVPVTCKLSCRADRRIPCFVVGNTNRRPYNENATLKTNPRLVYENHNRYRRGSTYTSSRISEWT